MMVLLYCENIIHLWYPPILCSVGVPPILTPSLVVGTVPVDKNNDGDHEGDIGDEDGGQDSRECF